MSELPEPLLKKNPVLWTLAVALLSAAISAGVTRYFFQPTLTPEEKGRRVEVDAGFQNLILEADPILRKLLALPTSATSSDMEVLEKEVTIWGQNVLAYVRPNYGAGQVSLLFQPSKDVPVIRPAAGYDPDVALRRANAIFKIYSVRTNLARLTDRLQIDR